MALQLRQEIQILLREVNMARIGKIKEIKVVPRIGKIISLEFLAKQKGIQYGKNQDKNKFPQG